MSTVVPSSASLFLSRRSTDASYGLVSVTHSQLRHQALCQESEVLRVSFFSSSLTISTPSSSHMLTVFWPPPLSLSCGTSTQGIFNSAVAVLKKMEQKKKQREDAREEIRGKPEGFDGEADDGGLRIESGDEDDE